MSEVTENERVAAKPAPGTWRTGQVYLMAVICLILGVAAGYFVKGSESSAPSQHAISSSAPVHTEVAQPANKPPSLEQMKQMGDRAAAPIKEKLKADPNNFEALNQTGNVYRATHQFKEAADYYRRALKIKPNDAAVRTDLASCLYYSGDVDGALTQLDDALRYNPKFFGALLNKGIIEFRAKKNVPEAVNSWQKILEASADPQQKELAQKLITDAKEQSKTLNEKERALGEN